MTTHDEHGPPPDEPGRTEKISPPATQIDVSVDVGEVKDQGSVTGISVARIDRACTARDMGWFNLEPPKEKLDHPVIGASWHDAVAYCAWLSSQAGRCLDQLWSGPY